MHTKTIEFPSISMFGHHGVFAQEKLMGHRFDVRVALGVEKWVGDKSVPINRDLLLVMVKQAMRPTQDLLEPVAERLADQVIEIFAPAALSNSVNERGKAGLQWIEVSVEKHQPQLALFADRTFVALRLEKQHKFEPTRRRCGVKQLRLELPYGIVLADIEAETIYKKPTEGDADGQEPRLQLADVFDYGLLAQAALAVSLKRPTCTTELIEMLQEQIIAVGKTLTGLTIRVRELQAHESGFMGEVVYTQSDSFNTHCPRCKKAMLCFKTASCWCKDFVLSDRSRQLLNRQYDKKCVCAGCLELFGNVL